MHVVENARTRIYAWLTQLRKRTDHSTSADSSSASAASFLPADEVSSQGVWEAWSSR